MQERRYKRTEGGIKLKYNPNPDDFDEFCEQFPTTVTILGRHVDFDMYVTEVYERGFSKRKSLFIKGIDIEMFDEYEEFADYYMEEVCDFIRYCLNQKEDGDEKGF